MAKVKIQYQPTIDLNEFNKGLNGMKQMLDSLNLSEKVKDDLVQAFKTIESLQTKIQSKAGKMIDIDEIKELGKSVKEIDSMVNKITKTLNVSNVGIFEKMPGVVKAMQTYEEAIEKADRKLQDLIKDRDNFFRTQMNLTVDDPRVKTLKTTYDVKDIGDIKEETVKQELLRLQKQINNAEDKNMDIKVKAINLVKAQHAEAKNALKTVKATATQEEKKNALTAKGISNDLAVAYSKSIENGLNIQATQLNKINMTKTETLQKLEKELALNQQLLAVIQKQEVKDLNTNILAGRIDLISKENEKTQKLSSTIDKTKKSVRQHSGEVKKGQLILEEHGKAIDNYKHNVQAATSKQKAFGDTFGSMGRHLAAITGGVALFNYATRSLWESVEVVRALDAAFVDIAVVTAQSRDQVWGSFDEFAALAKEYSVTTRDIASGSRIFYQQGLKANEVMEMTTASTIAAALGGVTMANAADTLTAAINGYNLEANKAMDITDKMAAVGAYSAADFHELSVAMEKVASSAYTAGVDFDHLMGYLGKMIETTREAPENLGTSMKTIIARINEIKADPAKALEDGTDFNRVEKALKSVGLALKDAQGNMLDTEVVFDSMGEKWKTFDRDQKAYLATMVAGARQQSRFMALMNDYDRTLELVRISQNSAGAALSQYDIYATGLEATQKRLTVELEKFAVNLVNPGLFSFILGGLEDVMGLVNKVTPAVTLLGIAFTTYGLRLIAMQGSLKNIMAAFKSTDVTGTFMQMAKADDILIAGIKKGKSLIASTTLAYQVLDSEIVTTIKTNTLAAKATDALSAAWMRSGMALKSFSIGFMSTFGPLGVAIAAIAGMVALAGIIYTISEAENKANQKIRESLKLKDEDAKVAKQQSQQLQNNIKRYKELMTIVNKTSQEEEELITLKQSMIAQSPQLLDSITKEGELRLKNIAIIEKEAAILESNAEQAQRLANQSKLEEYAAGLPVELGDNSKKVWEDYKNSSVMTDGQLKITGASGIKLEGKEPEELLESLKEVERGLKIKGRFSKAARTQLESAIASVSAIVELKEQEFNNLLKSINAGMTETAISEIKRTSDSTIGNASQDLAYAISNAYSEAIIAELGPDANSEEIAKAISDKQAQVQNLIKNSLSGNSDIIDEIKNEVSKAQDESASFNEISVIIGEGVDNLADKMGILQGTQDYTILKESLYDMMQVADVGKQLEEIFAELGVEANNRFDIKELFGGLGANLSGALIQQINGIETIEAKQNFLNKINGVFNNPNMSVSIEAGLENILKGMDLSTVEGNVDAKAQIVEYLERTMLLSPHEAYKIAKLITGDIPQELVNKAWTEQIKKLQTAVEGSKSLREEMLKGALSSKAVEDLMLDGNLGDFDKFVDVDASGTYTIAAEGLLYLEDKQQENYENDVQRKISIMKLERTSLKQKQIELLYLKKNTDAVDAQIAAVDEQIGLYEKLKDVQISYANEVSAYMDSVMNSFSIAQEDYDVAADAMKDMNTNGEISLKNIKDLLAANIEYAKFIEISETGIATLREGFHQAYIDMAVEKIKADIIQEKSINDKAIAELEVAKDGYDALVKIALDETSLYEDVNSAKIDAVQQYETAKINIQKKANEAADANEQDLYETNIDRLNKQIEGYKYLNEAKMGADITSLRAEKFATKQTSSKLEYDVDLDSYKDKIAQLGQDASAAIQSEIDNRKAVANTLNNLLQDGAIEKLLESTSRAADGNAKSLDKDAISIETFGDELQKLSEYAEKLTENIKKFTESIKGIGKDFTPFRSELEAAMRDIENYIDQFDKFYNYKRKMERVNTQQSLIESIMGNSRLTGEQYTELFKAQLGLTVGQSGIRLEYIDKLREELESQRQEIIDKYGEYYNFDVNGEIYLDYDVAVDDVETILLEQQQKIEALRKSIVDASNEQAQEEAKQEATEFLQDKYTSDKEAISKLVEYYSEGYKKLSEEIEKGENDLAEKIEKGTISASAAAESRKNLDEAKAKLKEVEESRKFYEEQLANVQAKIDGLDTTTDSYASTVAALTVELENLELQLTISEDNLAAKQQYLDDMAEAASEYSEVYSQLQEEIQGFIEDQSAMLEYRNQLIETTVDIEQQIYNALVEIREKEIESKQKQYNTYKQIDQDYLTSVKNAIQKERELRDRSQGQLELQQKQQRAALLSRDTSGAYASELSQLQKDINTSRQDLYDKQVDDRVSSLEQEINTRAELMDKEVAMLQEALDYYKENTQLLWQQVSDLFMQGADTVQAILEGTAEYINQSELSQMTKREEWEQKVTLAVENVATDMVYTLDMMIDQYQVMIDAFPEVVQAIEDAGEGYSDSNTTLLANMSNFTDQWEKLVQEANDRIGGSFFDAASKIDQSSDEVYNALIAAKNAFLQVVEDIKNNTITTGTTTGSGSNADQATAVAQGQTARQAIKKAAIDAGMEGRWDEGIATMDKLDAKAAETWFQKWIVPHTEMPETVKKLFADIVRAKFLWSGLGSPDTKGYSGGGLVDYTGIAQVHGSAKKPESFLDATDTANIAALKDVLKAINLPSANSLNASNNFGYGNGGLAFGDIEININIDKVDSELDLKELEKVVEKTILNTLSTKVPTTVTRKL